MSLPLLYILIILLIILAYETIKFLSQWLSKEFQMLWKEWRRIRQSNKNIVIEIDEDEIEATHIANNPHSQNTTPPRTHTLPAILLEARMVELEEKLARIEEAFGWDLKSQSEQPITIARIDEGNLTYIVVVESLVDDGHETLVPGQQNPRAIRPRFVKRPKEINEF